MEYRQLGRSGMKVSKMCVGTMKFRKNNEKAAKEVIAEAMDHGVNFIDTADVYGESEDIVGRALAEGNKRDRAVLATKFCWYDGKGPNDCGAGRKHIIEACEKSLRRLQTDYIDLYIIHVVDPNTPMEELLYTFDILARSGKVRYFGTSKHPSALILEGLYTSEKRGYPRFVSEQPPYCLLDRTPENELIPTCMKHGVGITPFMPLGSGLLTGKYCQGKKPKGSRMAKKTIDQDEIFTSQAIEAVEKMIPIAESKNITPAELALAWVMEQPGISSAILGARKPEYLRAGLNACNVTFAEDEMKELDRIFPPGRYFSNMYEKFIYRQYRGNYHAECRGSGAFIPRTETLPENGNS